MLHPRIPVWPPASWFLLRRFKPTLRVGTPVSNGNGAVVGVIVIDIDLAGLFKRLQSDLPDRHKSGFPEMVPRRADKPGCRQQGR